MKKFIVFALILLTAALFVSCGETETGKKDADTQDTEVYVDGNDNIINDPFVDIETGGQE